MGAMAAMMAMLSATQSQKSLSLRTNGRPCTISIDAPKADREAAMIHSLDLGNAAIPNPGQYIERDEVLRLVPRDQLQGVFRRRHGRCKR